MKEIKAIIRAYDKIQNGTCAALATVVRVEGSSYRRTGARMLVLDNGSWTGGISGGCLEGDALKRARLAINNSRPTLITYDTTDDDPHQIGVGLGCNGIIDVLFTPLNLSDKHNPIQILKACLREGRNTHVLITITDTAGNWQDIQPGDVIRYTGPESLSRLDSTFLKEAIDTRVTGLIAEGKSAPAQFGHGDRQLDLFIEILPPEIHVILMGHQYDVYPVSRLLKELDWRVSVCGDVMKVNPLVSALVDDLVGTASFPELVADEHTAIILMSHDYKTDKRNLLRALMTKVPFIGMLGPKVRSEKIWMELAQEGKPLRTTDMDRIHAPVGLDIGAVNPEEIALSLAAGVKAAFSKRDGAFLKHRSAPIHPRK
jgi:xanthine dehydrogenase accessory factor